MIGFSLFPILLYGPEGGFRHIDALCIGRYSEIWYAVGNHRMYVDMVFAAIEYVAGICGRFRYVGCVKNESPEMESIER